MREELEVWLWQERLRRAETARADWRKAARDSLEHFLGLARTDEGDREVIVNKQYAVTRTLHAGVMPRRWRMRLRGLRPMDDPAAKRAENLGNWNWHAIRFGGIANAMELTGQVHGVAISYTTWDREHTPVVGEGPNGERIAGLAPAGRNATDPDATVTEAPDVANPDPLNGENLSRTYQIPSEDYLQDPKATTTHAARWAAHALYCTEWEARQMQRRKFFRPDLELAFKKELASDPMEADLPNDETEPPADVATGSADDPLTHFNLWRYWMIHDFVGKRVLYVMFGTAHFLRAPKINELGNPYRAYRPDETADRFWSLPPSYIYRPAQQALNRVKNSKVLYANLLSAPRIFVPNSITPTEEEQIAESQPGELVKLAPQTLGSMRFTELHPGSPSINDLEASLSRDITEMSAVSEIGSGVAQGLGTTTATAAQLSAGAQSLRSGDYRQLLIVWATEVARRTVYLLQELFDKADAIPILGPTEAEQWGVTDYTGPVRGEELRGTFDFELAVADDAEHLRAEDRKLAMDAMNLFATFITNPDGTPGIVDPVSLLTWGANKLDMPTELIRRENAMRAQAPMAGSAPMPTSREQGQAARGPARGPQNPAGLPAPDLENRRGNAGAPGAQLSAGQQPARVG